MIRKIAKSKRVWGLYVGEIGISAVKVSKSTDALIVEAFDTINYSDLDSNKTKSSETEQNIQFKSFPVDSSSTGKTRQGVKIDDIAKLLKNAIDLFLTRNQINSSDKILIALPSQFVLSRFVNLPSVGKRQLKEIVRFEVEKHIPININEIIWDFHSLGDEAAVNKKVEIGIFAIKKTDIYTFLSGLEEIKDVLTTVQISSIALYNFLSFNNQTVEPTLLIEVGSENTNLMIIDSDKFWIRNVPSSDIGDSFVNEVKRSIGYYESLVKDINIKNLIVAGNIQEEEKKQFLADRLGFTLVEVSTNDNIVVSDLIDSEEFDNNKSKLSIPLGLAMQGLSIGRIDINLVPEEYAQKIAISAKKKFVLFSSIAILISVIILFFSIRREHERVQYYSNTGLNTLKKAASLDRQFKSLNKEYKAKANNIEQIVSMGRGRAFWFKALPKIIDSMPEEIELFRLNSKWITSPENAILMSLIGKSYNPRLDYINKKVKDTFEKLVIYDEDLKEVRLFEDINIVPGSIRDDKDGINFEIQWIVKLNSFFLLSSNSKTDN